MPNDFPKQQREWKEEQLAASIVRMLAACSKKQLRIIYYFTLGLAGGEKEGGNLGCPDRLGQTGGFRRRPDLPD